MTIFSGHSVISRVYTSRFGNGTGSHGTSTEVVLKKYQVPGTVPSGKPPKSEPYRTVPCRTMQWKSAISSIRLTELFAFVFIYSYTSLLYLYFYNGYYCSLIKLTFNKKRQSYAYCCALLSMAPSWHTPRLISKGTVGVSQAGSGCAIPNRTVLSRTAQWTRAI